jgi:hypothetical protein
MGSSRNVRRIAGWRSNSKSTASCEVGLTRCQAGAQPFDSAPPNLRMNPSAGRSTSSGPTKPELAAGEVLDLFGQLFDLFGLSDHRQGQHVGGIGFLDFVFQFAGKAVELFDVIVDLLFILFQNLLGVRLGGVVTERIVAAVVYRRIAFGQLGAGILREGTDSQQRKWGSERQENSWVMKLRFFGSIMRAPVRGMCFGVRLAAPHRAACRVV